MKSLDEIQEILISELCSNLDNINLNVNRRYYNELLGDSSFLIGGYLQHQLRNNFDDWDTKKWIDDSLITRIFLDKKKLSIWGIIIWGVENVCEQYTEPFYFEVNLNEERSDFTESTLLFGDLENSEITYQEFKDNRGFWDQEYYPNGSWYPFDRNWRYIINSKNKYRKPDVRSL